MAGEMPNNPFSNEELFQVVQEVSSNQVFDVLFTETNLSSLIHGTTEMASLCVGLAWFMGGPNGVAELENQVDNESMKKLIKIISTAVIATQDPS